MNEEDIITDEGELNIEAVKDLPFPHCRNLDLTDNGAKVELPDEYMDQFLPIHYKQASEEDEYKKVSVHIFCVCGGILYGSPAGLLDTFTWGLAHGDGFCVRCKWPTRFYHTLPNGLKFSLPLQVHPSLFLPEGEIG